jgi:ABC-type multidrug transport system fused ATPase/permease subunit
VQVGLVSQEPTLFQTTIMENIALGRAGATEEEIHEAARRANAHKFISIMPAGYHTQVSGCMATGLFVAARHATVKFISIRPT